MILFYMNTKGGVGTSTLAANHAVWLYDNVSTNVALLDVDDQFHSSRWVQSVEPGITVRRATTPAEAKARLNELALTHEYVIADGPKGKDKQNIAVLLHADAVVVPLQPSGLDFITTLNETTKVILAARKKRSGEPKFVRVVINRIDRRTKRSRSIDNALKKTTRFAVANTMIGNFAAIADGFDQRVATRMTGTQACRELEALYAELLSPLKGVANA